MFTPPLLALAPIAGMPPLLLLLLAVAKILAVGLAVVWPKVLGPRVLTEGTPVEDEEEGKPEEAAAVSLVAVVAGAGNPPG